MARTPPSRPSDPASPQLESPLAPQPVPGALEGLERRLEFLGRRHLDREDGREVPVEEIAEEPDDIVDRHGAHGQPGASVTTHVKVNRARPEEMRLEELDYVATVKIEGPDVHAHGE